MRTWRPLETVIERIERASVLDPVADPIVRAARATIPRGPVDDVLSGTPIGHPLHPALVALPIGAWSSAVVFDLVGDGRGARRLIGLGCVAALPAAAAGASGWSYTTGAERRVGLVHALLNDGALTLYLLSWRARRRGARGRGVALSLAGSGLLGAAGWLGGHLAYSQGVGVDTTAFQQVPQEWTDAGPDPAVTEDGAVASATAAGIPLLVVRRDGALIVLADRCTHRGGVLHEGSVDAGCVTCPLHGSVFSLDDGAVVSGPATRPQPLFEARVRDGRLEVRRAEARALRSNPVGR